MTIVPQNAPKGASRASTPFSGLLARYGQKLLDAHELHKNDPTAGATSFVKPAPASPDYFGRIRSTAALLAYLQNDTPQRAAILTAAGLDPATFDPRHIVNLSRTLFSGVDRLHHEEFSEPFGALDNDPAEVDGLSPGLKTRRLCDVEARPVEWLWPQRVPLGKVTLLSGDPNLGKTWLTLDMIARITTGRDFPDAPNPFSGDTGHSKRRDALWVSGEDSDEDTVKPRLQMLNADTSRVESLSHVSARVDARSKRGGKLSERTLSLADDLDALDQWLTDHPLCVVVVIDPFAAFMGKTDTHRNSDVRALLTPLAKLAERHRVAIVGINHLSKGDGGNAMYRSMGSMAFVAAARSAWMVSKCPNEPTDRRLLTCIKANLASENVGGLAFRVGPNANGILWEEGQVHTTADEAVACRRPEQESAPARAEAKDWLRELLAGGPVPAADVWEQAKADGLRERTVKTAKKELGVQTSKVGDGWLWELPQK